jgi:hypothetical protein
MQDSSIEHSQVRTLQQLRGDGSPLPLATQKFQDRPLRCTPVRGLTEAGLERVRMPTCPHIKPRQPSTDCPRARHPQGLEIRLRKFESCPRRPIDCRSLRAFVDRPSWTALHNRFPRRPEQSPAYALDRFRGQRRRAFITSGHPSLPRRIALRLGHSTPLPAVKGRHRRMAPNVLCLASLRLRRSAQPGPYVRAM